VQELLATVQTGRLQAGVVCSFKMRAFMISSSCVQAQFAALSPLLAKMESLRSMTDSDLGELMALSFAADKTNAAALLNLQQWPVAQSFLVACIAKWQRRGFDSGAVATLQSQLAMVYRKQDKIQDALACYEAAIKVLDSEPGLSTLYLIRHFLIFLCSS